MRGWLSHSWPLLQLTMAEAHPTSFVLSIPVPPPFQAGATKWEGGGAQKSSLNCHLRHLLVDIFSVAQGCSGELIGSFAWGPAEASLLQALPFLASLLPFALASLTRCRTTHTALPPPWQT